MKTTILIPMLWQRRHGKLFLEMHKDDCQGAKLPDWLWGQDGDPQLIQNSCRHDLVS
jgi:hypothetical protein